LSIIKKEKISAKGFDIEVYTEDFKNDYISLTDIAKYKNKEEPNVVVSNWMRNYNTKEYLGIWEQLNNPDFNPLEFEGYLKDADSNAFTLSPRKWQKTTNAEGLFVKLGRYGGTYAHKDYQRLKEDENSKLSLTCNLHREISKINYKIHTDAIREY
jgi:hypothetical protein